MFRLNIKFHGSTFRNAPELVGLDPQDTFALATYKFYGALEKQVAEHLPYIFVVIGVARPDGCLQVGDLIPVDLPGQLVALALRITPGSSRQALDRGGRAVVRVLDHPDAYKVGTNHGLLEHAW